MLLIFLAWAGKAATTRDCVDAMFDAFGEACRPLSVPQWERIRAHAIDTLIAASEWGVRVVSSARGGRGAAGGRQHTQDLQTSEAAGCCGQLGPPH